MHFCKKSDSLIRIGIFGMVRRSENPDRPGELTIEWLELIKPVYNRDTMWSHVHPDVQPSQNSILNGLFNAFLMLGLGNSTN